MTTLAVPKILARPLRALRPDNLGHRVSFLLDGIPLTRRLVAGPAQDILEISAASLVGKALRHATPGERLTVQAPVGILSLEIVEIDPDGKEREQ